MKRFALALVVLLSVGMPSQHATAAGVCREGCKLWCDANRPLETCYSACVGRPSCLTGDSTRIRGGTCRAWCQSNKPGNFACLGDCAARDAKYGR